MDFEKICMLFTGQEPFYGILLSSMDRIPTKSIETLGVGRSGNVFKLYYNPDFVNQFDIDTTLQLIKHECLHVAFNSWAIWDGADKHDPEEIHKLRNVAADLEINCYLDRSKMQKEAGGMWVEDLGFNRYEGTREYFRQLLQLAQPPKPQQYQAQNPSQPCNDGLGGQTQQPQSQSQSPKQQEQSEQDSSTPQPDTNPDNGQGQEQGQGQQEQEPAQPQINKEYVDKLSTMDDHSNWPDDMTDAEMEQLKQVVDDMLVFAAEEVEKGRGTIPGELAGRLTELRKRKPKPVADWKRYFRRYLGNEFSEFIRKSKKRESRRFPDAAGNRHRRKSHILVAIDTSGSVSMPEFREFFGQIKTLMATADFHVVECDADIQYEYDYKGRPNEQLHGGGGTDFQPVVDLYNKNKRKYDALVFFTDGYATIPKDTPKDTLWVISSNGDQSERKRYRVNGASVAFIPKKQE